MYTIRQAHIEDVPHLAEMGKKFCDYSEYGKLIGYDVDSVTRTLAQLILHGFLYVAEHDKDGVIGVIAGTMTTAWFNQGVPIAAELAWWVEKEHRNSSAAIKLYKKFEKWAQERGVKVFTMSDLVIDGEPPADKLFKKLGYSVAERSQIKRG